MMAPNKVTEKVRKSLMLSQCTGICGIIDNVTLEITVYLLTGTLPTWFHFRLQSPGGYDVVGAFSLEQ